MIDNMSGQDLEQPNPDVKPKTGEGTVQTWIARREDAWGSAALMLQLGLRHKQVVIGCLAGGALLSRQGKLQQLPSRQ